MEKRGSSGSEREVESWLIAKRITMYLKTFARDKTILDPISFIPKRAFEQLVETYLVMRQKNHKFQMM
jgi:hypothetical protein